VHIAVHNTVHTTLGTSHCTSHSALQSITTHRSALGVHSSIQSAAHFSPPYKMLLRVNAEVRVLTLVRARAKQDTYNAGRKEEGIGFSVAAFRIYTTMKFGGACWAGALAARWGACGTCTYEKLRWEHSREVWVVWRMG